MTLGEAIREGRRVRSLSQKDLAAELLKEDGSAISPQYLNDIERDRRVPPSYLIDHMAKKLKLDADYLHALAGQFPADVRLGRYQPETVQAALKAFRRSLK